MASSNSLTPLQRELLHAFFERTQSFFLTGGGALIEFYLHHRDTEDLDFFATKDADPDEGARALRGAGEAVGAAVSLDRQSHDFRRFIVTRGDEETLVDIVIDRAPQVVWDKPSFGRIR